jgi:hypothetical protein
MNTPTLDQSQAQTQLEALQLTEKYLSTAVLRLRDKNVKTPALTGDILEDIRALELHCLGLQTQLSLKPAASAPPEVSNAALTKERDDWKAKAEKAQSEITGLKADIEGMEAKYRMELQKQLMAKLVAHGINLPLNNRSQLGEKATLTEKVLAKKGVASLAELEQKRTQQTT